MNAGQLEPRDVAKVVATALVVIALAFLFVIVLLDVTTTIRWLFAALFLALALGPAVTFIERRLRIRGHSPPRWAAVIFVLVSAFVIFGAIVVIVAPALVTEVEMLGRQLPEYARDFEKWAEQSKDFRELNDRYDLIDTIKQQASNLPSRIGDAANELRVISVEVLTNLFAAIAVLVIAFFMLLDGDRLFMRSARRLPSPHGERLERIGDGIYGVVRAYVTVNVILAIASGLFTWIVLTLLGVDIAVPLAILVALFDLVPLVGLTVGGAFVALIAAIHSLPALIIWVVLFLIYQQAQDRFVQPMLYGKAVQIHPLIAILVLLMGAQVAGILGALLAIPAAASLGVIFSELFGSSLRPAEEEEAASQDTQDSSGLESSVDDRSGPTGPGAAPPEPA
ncbi:MAG: AI-2E family transporter [Solirubrobacterales bacterium]